MIKAIFASDTKGGFGQSGMLPWPSIKEDFEHFKNITQDNYIAMGYNTYKTLPVLQGRTPLVITDSTRDDVDIDWDELDVLSLKDELISYDAISTCDIVLIGGAKILTPENLALCGEIYYTEVIGEFKADVFLGAEVFDHLDTLDCETLLQTEKCSIRRYT